MLGNRGHGLTCLKLLRRQGISILNIGSKFNLCGTQPHVIRAWVLLTWGQEEGTCYESSGKDHVHEWVHQQDGTSQNPTDGHGDGEVTFTALGLCDTHEESIEHQHKRTECQPNDSPNPHETWLNGCQLRNIHHNDFVFILIKADEYYSDTTATGKIPNDFL